MARRVNNNRRRNGTSSLAGFINMAVSTVASPVFLISLALYYYNAKNPELLNKFLDKLIASKLFQQIGTYLKQHLDQTEALLFFYPLVTFMSPNRFMLAYIIFATILVFFLPKANMIEYIFLGYFTILFIRARSAKFKFFVIILIILTIGLGLWGESFLAWNNAAGDSDCSRTTPNFASVRCNKLQYTPTIEFIQSHHNHRHPPSSLVLSLLPLTQCNSTIASYFRSNVTIQKYNTTHIQYLYNRTFYTTSIPSHVITCATGRRVRSGPDPLVDTHRHRHHHSNTRVTRAIQIFTPSSINNQHVNVMREETRPSNSDNWPLGGRSLGSVAWPSGP